MMVPPGIAMGPTVVMKPLASCDLAKSFGYGNPSYDLTQFALPVFMSIECNFASFDRKYTLLPANARPRCLPVKNGTLYPPQSSGSLCSYFQMIWPVPPSTANTLLSCGK